jgi:Polyketide cyclase / dehydrase and lipid transport
MKIKMILSILAFAIIAFLAIGCINASKLTHINIVKSVTVQGSLQEVFDMVKYLKNFPRWSPFLAEDPGQKYEVKGTDGAVGAQYHWNGNGGKDLGYQEIKKIEEGRFIGMQCDISKPFVAKPTFDYSFEETPNGIVVTQDFKVDSPFMDAFFMGIFGAKAGMEKMNQQGLDLLKKAVENKN